MKILILPIWQKKKDHKSVFSKIDAIQTLGYITEIYVSQQICAVQVFHLAYFGDLSAELPDWAASLACTSHLLLVTNSSTNILVYCWKDRAVNEPSRRFTGSMLTKLTVHYDDFGKVSQF